MGCICHQFWMNRVGILEDASPLGTKEISSEAKSTTRKQTTVRLLIVVSIPIICLLSMTIAGLVNATVNKRQADVSSQQVLYGMEVANLVKGLQIERGLTTVFLSGNESTESVSHERVGVVSCCICISVLCFFVD